MDSQEVSRRIASIKNQLNMATDQKQIVLVTGGKSSDSRRDTTVLLTLTKGTVELAFA